MGGRRLTPIFTESFAENLEAIRAFLDHPIRSLETRAAVRRLRRLLRPGDDLREFILSAVTRPDTDAAETVS